MPHTPILASLNVNHVVPSPLVGDPFQVRGHRLDELPIPRPHYFITGVLMVYCRDILVFAAGSYLGQKFTSRRRVQDLTFKPSN